MVNRCYLYHLARVQCYITHAKYNIEYPKLGIIQYIIVLKSLTEHRFYNYTDISVTVKIYIQIWFLVSVGLKRLYDTKTRQRKYIISQIICLHITFISTQTVQF